MSKYGPKPKGAASPTMIVASAAVAVGAVMYGVMYPSPSPSQRRCIKGYYTGTGHPVCTEYECVSKEKPRNKP